uniref:Bms1-type G domain-containing protein n=1 Tax=Ananas comosus var. bracteatus TaxID=296719 RepID=A0A6V7PRE7_ANACO|nr:unnamed protein product [Ananas comosus var. bracteatus]
MGGSRTQVNKPHKTRFASKASRHAHKTSVSDKSRIAKPDAHRAAVKGARAARIQRNKAIRDQKRAALLNEKRASSGSASPPRVVVLFGLSSDANTNLVAKDLLTLSLEEDREPNGTTIASSFYKLRMTVLEAPYGDLLSCMELAKVADMIAFVVSANSLCDKASSSLIDDFGKQCLSVFRSIGLPSTAVLIRDLPPDIKSKQELKKMSISCLSSELPEDCRFYAADTKEDLHKFMWLFKEQHLSSPHWRSQRPYVMSQEVCMEPGDGIPGMCTLLLSGYVRAHSLSVNQLVSHVSGLGDFQLSKIDILKDPSPLNVRKDSASMDSEDNGIQIIGTLIPDPMAHEPLIIENIPDPLPGNRLAASAPSFKLNKHLWFITTWPTESEMAEADASNKQKKLIRKKLPKGTSDYQAAWILDDSDNEDSGSSEEEGDGMVLDEHKDRLVEEGADYSDTDEIPQLLENFEEETEADTEMADDENLTKEQIEAEIRRIKDANAKIKGGTLVAFVEEFPDEVDTPIDTPARKRFAKYRGLKSFRTSSWDPKESLPPEYARIFAFDNFSRTQKHAFVKVQQLDRGTTNDCAQVGSFVRLHVKHVPVEAASTACHLSKRLPVVACGLLQHESKMSVLHFRSATSRCCCCSLKSVDPDRIILKKIILTGYPQRVSKSKAIVRYMFHHPEDVRWFKAIDVWTKHGRHGRVKEPVGTHGAMKCVFNSAIQQHDTVCMSLYKRAYPKWPNNIFHREIAYSVAFVVLFGLSSDANTNLVAKDLLTLSLEEDREPNGTTIASSFYKLRMTVLEAPYGDLLSCMELAKVADMIAFVVSANSLCDKASSSLIDDFGKQCLSVFRSIGLPVQLSCGFSRSNTSHLLIGEAETLCYVSRGLYGARRWHPGMCTLLLSGYVRAHSLSVNQLVHVSGLGDFQLSKIDILKDPSPLNVRKDSASMDSEDNGIQIIGTLIPDPMAHEPLIIENIPDPLAGEQTWPTESEMAEADASNKQKKLIRKKLPKGTSDYQAAWILDDSDNEDSGSSEEEGDGMVLDEHKDRLVEEGADYSDTDEIPQLLENFEEETEADTEMADDENLTKEQIEAEIRRIKDANAEDQEFPDEVDTPIDTPARKRFAKYRGLKSFRTSSWDPKESLPPEYARIFAFDNFSRTQKHAFVKVQELDRGTTNDCAQVGSFVRLHVKHVPVEAASTACHLSKRLPVVACGLLQHESKMSVLHFSVKKNDSYDAPIKSKEVFTFHVGFRQFTARPLFSSDNINCDKHKMERFLHAGRFSVASIYGPICYPPLPLIVLKNMEGAPPAVAAVGSLKSVDPDRIILKKIILTGYPQRVSKSKAIVRYMFHHPEDVRWFKASSIPPVDVWTKHGRHGRVKEPVGTHGAMKCVFNSAIQQHDTERGRRKRVVKRVAWVDEVGGQLENIKCDTYEEKATKAGCGKAYKGEQRGGVNVEAPRGKAREMINDVNAEDPGAKTRELVSESRWVSSNKSEDESFKPQVPLAGTYKEVLLRKTSHQTFQRNSYLSLRSATRSHWRLAYRNTKGRCLASDHKAAECGDPVRNARPHQASLRAWIRLINLPFECWTVARVAAMVSGFGRFVMADETTKAMTDLHAFRCQITLDSITDIPQNLAVVLGEELFSVMIHLEDWERVVDVAGRHPPALPQNEPANRDNQPDGRRADPLADRQKENMEEDMGDEAGELDEVHSERSLTRGARQAPIQRLMRRERRSLAGSTRLSKRPPWNTIGQRAPSTGENRGGRALRRLAYGQRGVCVSNPEGGITKIGQRATRQPRLKLLQATVNPKTSNLLEWRREGDLGKLSSFTLLRKNPSFMIERLHRVEGLTKIGMCSKLKPGLGQPLGVTLLLGERLSRSLMMGGGGHVKMGAREVPPVCVYGQSVNYLG